MVATNHQIAVLILAGGQSSRMGTDKALLVIDNQRFIQRVCKVAVALSPQVYVLTPWRDRYQDFLTNEVQFLLESNHGSGPLIALAEGLAQISTTQISTNWILLLACDLPLLKINVFQDWMNQLDQVPDSILAVVPRQDGIWEPLCGFYRKEALTNLQDFIDKGGRSFQNWLREISVIPLLVGKQASTMLWNCNTPSEFEQLKNMKNLMNPEKSIGEYWLLEKDITFLNHGAFGACPIPVLAAQTQFREQLEREPLRFLMREFEPLLDAARIKLAEFIGAKENELVFVPNATTGVNTILRSLSFSPDDELLTTNQEYNACRNVIDFVANRTGVKIIVAQVPFPIESSQQVIEAVINCISPRTKLALLDHVVSQTGLIFPIKQLVKELTNHGVDTLIDGAHAPGMVALNLHEIGATYYTGNCHKWLCAPKGAGFLYVRSDKQEGIRPMIISHGANSPRTDKSRFQLEFDWMGTDDFSAYLSVPVAIEFMGSLLTGGWEELREKNHKMVLAGRQILIERLGLSLLCPDEMVGSMVVIALPDGDADIVRKGGLPPIQNELWERFKIEVPVIPWPDASNRLVRISAQVYNSLSQYEYLAEALVELLDLSSAS